MQEQSVIFAGTAGGLYRSRDLGSSWQSVGEGMTNKFITALATRPGSPDTLYAGTNGGVFKTTDGGAHWKAVALLPKESSANTDSRPATPNEN